MVRGIINSNHDRYSDEILRRLEILASDMENNRSIETSFVTDNEKSDYPFAKEWLTEYETKFANKQWKNVPFYWIEAFLFRVILEKCEYFDAKSKSFGVDPFYRSKLREAFRNDIWLQLEKSLSYLHSAKANNNDKKNEITFSDQLYYAITCDLWANKLDLNFKPGSQEKLASDNDHKMMDEHLLHDDRKGVIDYLISMKGKDNNKQSIDFICDNSGAEFLNDLLFADYLLLNKFTNKVIMHVKLYPTYVSDVTMQDVDNHLSWLCVHTLQNNDDNHLPNVSQFYHRLCRHIKNDKLIFKDDHFWNSTKMFNQMPNELFNKQFNKNNCKLVISKGDANYRRLVLAAKWQPFEPFENVLSYFPTNCLALRTMKSDAVCGIDKKIVDKVEKADPKWRHNGERGLIQFYAKKK